MRKYILYDGRAMGGGGTENASVLTFCDTMAEAKSWKGQFGPMACYSYRAVKYEGPTHEGNNTLDDERWEWDYCPKEVQS